MAQQTQIHKMLVAAGYTLKNRVKTGEGKKYYYYYTGPGRRPMIGYPVHDKETDDTYVERVKQAIESHFKRHPEDKPHGWKW